jgi:hypothetical protein
MAGKKNPKIPVSSGNPCPFLRALVADGRLADDVAPLQKVATVIVDTARAGEGQPALPRAAILAIGLIANGLGPLSMAATLRTGLRLAALRGGPLDKKGVGSGILDGHGNVSPKELARLGEFSRSKRTPAGAAEPGLGLPELRAYMDANFERAAGRRRRADRALMNGEWPVLLKVMGLDGPDGRYLSLHEVEALFKERKLPQRMLRPPAKGSMP